MFNVTVDRITIHVPQVLRVLSERRIRPAVSMRAFNLCNFIYYTFRGQGTFCFTFQCARCGVRRGAVGGSFGGVLSVMLSMVVVSSLVAISLSMDTIRSKGMEMVIEGSACSMRGNTP